jgi:2-oxoglutarate dehydrogenase E1 component
VKEAADNADPGYLRIPEYPKKPDLGGDRPRTAISAEMLEAISAAYTSIPEGFTLHPKVSPQIERRAQAITTGPIDWGTGESIAFGSLLLDGRPVRLSGQDSRRGTFTTRFATVTDRHTGLEWTPLTHISANQAKFHVYDSALSEYAVLGFEYGYSVARPDALTVWEAQFGDFVNGAQSIIDEYLAAGESKWGQKSGVVLLLPHGHEGQGPDHTSARPERFLSLAADDHITIAQPSTPASYFHLLRRHTLGLEHRPLVVLTPKSMLRNKAAVSPTEDFTSGEFRPVIGDETAAVDDIERVILCSGKVAWDLFAERDKREGASPRTAIVRLEQLYPRPIDDVEAVVRVFPNVEEIRWVQEEPANQGAWLDYALRLKDRFADLPIVLVSRPELTARSVGSNAGHVMQQRRLMDEAFAGTAGQGLSTL